MILLYTYVQIVHSKYWFSVKERKVFPRHGLASLHSTDSSTWQGHTVDTMCDRGAKAIRLSDPQFLPVEFPQFGHCRGVTLGKVFQPAAKPPGYWRPKCSWRGVVNLPEANQLLKIIPEAVPTLNPCANMCQYDAQEYYFLLAHN